MAERKHHMGIGNRIAPPRFIAFTATTLVAVFVLRSFLGLRYGIMAGFDVGALLFFLICIPLLNHKAERMRISACKNDANRPFLLLITGGVMLVILAAIFSELKQKAAPHPWLLVLTVGTLIAAWLFSNLIYALHYAHLFYREGTKGDCGGLSFPETEEPDYWDFIYFAYCLGMTFQTSDVSVTSGAIRRAVTVHCLAAFVFNLGVLAFTINVLGSS
jgi:uncharacterized membrane protein